jgi:hypothetical protein
MESSVQAKGKWINISEVRLSDDIEVITFENGEPKYRTYYFEFGKSSLQPSKVKNYFGKLFNLNYEVLNAKRIRFNRKGVFNQKIEPVMMPVYSDAVNFQDYIKLTPTKCRIKESEILQSKYVFYWREENHLIKFNESLTFPLINANDKAFSDEDQRMFLEKVEKTLLITLYANDKRKLIFPIKEIDDSKVVLRGLPRTKFEVVGTRWVQSKV